jgi:hypothetical protein
LPTFQPCNPRSGRGVLGNILGADKHGQVPAVYRFSFGVQQELARGTTLDVAYVGTSRATSLPRVISTPSRMGLCSAVPLRIRTAPFSAALCFPSYQACKENVEQSVVVIIQKACAPAGKRNRRCGRACCSCRKNSSHKNRLFVAVAVTHRNSHGRLLA